MTNREALRTAYEYLNAGKIHISPAQAAPLLGSDGFTIGQTAKEGKLGLPCFISGNTAHIGVAGIIRFLQGGIDPIEGGCPAL